MVTEAVAVKVSKLDEMEADEKKKADWRSNRDNLKEAVATAEVNAQP